MSRKKSASPLAMSFLVWLALLVPCAGQAGADQITIPSWLAWQQSTQVNYDDAVPWGGVSSLPALETFTLGSEAYTGPYVENIPGSTTLFAGPGVRYYHALFGMPDFGNIVADLQISVDNDVEIYINRHLLARAGSLSQENFLGPPLSVSLNGSGLVDNGAFDLQPFDWAAPTFPKSNWVRGGVNEVLVVVRNLSYETGGFSFVMGIATYPSNPPTLHVDPFGVIVFKNYPTPISLSGPGTVAYFDMDGDPLSVTNVTQGVNGSVVVGADGKGTYTGNYGFTGQDSFIYTVSDGVATATGSVDVYVIESVPLANPDSTTTDQDTPVTLLVTANDSDLSGDPLSVTGVWPGANGSVSFHADGRVTYTPNPNFTGRDTFTYRITDGFAVNHTWVTVTVSPVNHPPTAAADLAHVTFGGTATTDVVANDLDIDGDALTVTAVTQPALGRAEIVDNKVVYTNTAPSQSTYDDSLSYTVSDGHGESATATLKLKFVARLPALSVPGPLTVKAGVPLRFTVKALDPNYSPPATLSTEVVSRTLPAGASFRNDTLSWTPQSEQAGTHNLVFGARTNTSPSQLLTKAVAVTVKPNRYPDLIVGGEPRVWEEPGYWERDSTWVFLGYNEELRGAPGYYMHEWQVTESWYPPERRIDGYPGLYFLKKHVTPPPNTTWHGFRYANSFHLGDTGVHSNYAYVFSPIARPAVGNIDGVEFAEMVMGAGPGSGGLLAVRTYSGEYWTKIVNAGWASYNQANGETWPAVGNLNGTDYLLVGLGKGGFGYIQAFLWRSGEIVYGGHLALPDANNYNATNGTTRPTVGDLTGDGHNEIVVGVDGYGGGMPTRAYIMTLAAGEWRYTPLEIPAVAGLEDARYNCETWPAIGDLNGDGKNELVINVTKTIDGTRQPVGFGVWTSVLADEQLTLKLQTFKKAATFGLPALGDVFTPDGKAEIVLSQGPGSYTLSVFDVEIANGEWTILPEGITAGWTHNPFPAFGEVSP